MLCLLTASPPLQSCLTASSWRFSQMPSHSRSTVTDSMSGGPLPLPSPPLPHRPHLLWPHYKQACTLESLIWSVPCLLFIMMLRFPCIAAAGSFPKSRVTPPSFCLQHPSAWVFLAQSDGGTVKSAVRERVMWLICYSFSYWVNPFVFGLIISNSSILNLRRSKNRKPDLPISSSSLFTHGLPPVGS